MFVFASAAALLSGCGSSPVSPLRPQDVVVNYVIPSASHVTIRIVNSYNTTVATLVDTTESAGLYSVTWNTAGYHGGIYFYYLSAIPVDGGKSLSAVKELVIRG